jgi:hypothetical protein
MIPDTILTDELVVSDEVEATKTYKITADKIQGFTDNIEALKQAIYKRCNTEMYEHPIYSFSYGIQTEDLIGKDIIYVKSELKRRLRECLMQDDRVLSVDGFFFSSSGDSLTCTFNVASTFGEIPVTKEVIV